MLNTTNALSCPFCGSPAIVDVHCIEAPDWWACAVICSAEAGQPCNAQVIGGGDTEQEALNNGLMLWNRRAERTAKIEMRHGDHPPYPLFEGDAWTAWFVCAGCKGAVDPGDEYCKHCGAKLEPYDRLESGE